MNQRLQMKVKKICAYISALISFTFLSFAKESLQVSLQQPDRKPQSLLAPCTVPTRFHSNPWCFRERTMPSADNVTSNTNQEPASSFYRLTLFYFRSAKRTCFSNYIYDSSECLPSVQFSISQTRRFRLCSLCQAADNQAVSGQKYLISLFD